MTATAKVVIRASKYDTFFKRIDTWDVPAEDKKAVKEFLKEYELGKITGTESSESTREHYIIYLRKALQFLDKPVKSLTEKDIDEFCSALSKNVIRSSIRGVKKVGEETIELEGKPLSAIVKKKIKVLLLKFLEWKFEKEPKKMLILKSLRTKEKIKRREPESMTLAEIDKLYKGAKNEKERYLIALLFSSGARIAEFCNIRVNDLEIPKGGETFMKLTLRNEFSKTQGRTISLYYANVLEAVTEYLEVRRNPILENSGIGGVNKREYSEIKNNEEPVWPYDYNSTQKLIARMGMRVLKKRINPHLFRHSCATWMADKLNHQQLAYFFGWKFSSPMPDIYIKRKGMVMKDVDDKIQYTEMNTLKAKLDKNSLESKELKANAEYLTNKMVEMEKEKEMSEMHRRSIEAYMKKMELKIKKMEKKATKEELRELKEIEDDDERFFQLEKLMENE